MQIILREDVPHLGRRGDVVTVKDGYARNYLIPKGYAYRLTEGIRRQVEIESRAKAAREERERAAAEKVAEKLRELGPVRFTRKAGETGHLFGSVTNIDIARELESRGIEVDRHRIRLEEPIKAIGTHRVKVHVHRDIEDVELIIEVEPEEDGASA